MSDLYYLLAEGHSRHSNWQIGMYAESAVLTTHAVMLTWEAALHSLFVSSGLSPDGWCSKMGNQGALDTCTTYLVDQVTDRKTQLEKVALNYPGTWTQAVEVCNTVAVTVLFRSADNSDRALGRVYMPPFGNDVFQEFFDSVSQGLVRDYWQAALTEMSSNLLLPVIRSRMRHRSKLVATFEVSAKYSDVPSRRDPRTLTNLIGFV